MIGDAAPVRRRPGWPLARQAAPAAAPAAGRSGHRRTARAHGPCSAGARRHSALIAARASGWQARCSPPSSRRCRSSTAPNPSAVLLPPSGAHWRPAGRRMGPVAGTPSPAALSQSAARATIGSVASVGALAVIFLGAVPMAAAQANPDAAPILAQSLAGSAASMNFPAKGFQLTDQRGPCLTLASLRGKVVLLTFLDPVCTSACPLIAQEFRAAATCSVPLPGMSSWSRSPPTLSSTRRRTPGSSPARRT